MGLSREAILGARDRHVSEVAVPEWGGSVYVRSLTGAERDILEHEWNRMQSADKPQPLMRAAFVQLVACDADGSLLFSPDDVQPISEKNAVALSRIFDAAFAINFVTEEDVEDLAKNYGMTTA